LLARQRKLRCLGAGEDLVLVAEDLLGVLGLAASNVTEDQLREAVATAVAQLPEGPTEAEARRQLTWKVGDIPKRAERARRGRETAGGQQSEAEWAALKKADRAEPEDWLEAAMKHSTGAPG